MFTSLGHTMIGLLSGFFLSIGAIALALAFIFWFTDSEKDTDQESDDPDDDSIPPHKENNWLSIWMEEIYNE